MTIEYPFPALTDGLIPKHKGYSSEQWYKRRRRLPQPSTHNATQIEDLLPNVNTRKACGHDMLSPCLIKESSRAIAGPVAKILNTSVAHSRYPSRWKVGQVTPLFKRDEELDRPETVLPCLNNIFERLPSGPIQDF